MSKLLKSIIVATLLCFIYLFPTIAHAACAENEIDVLGDGTQCEITKLTLTLRQLMVPGIVIRFDMSAMGTFYVDCGSGGTLGGTGASGKTITRSDTNNATYTCTYSTNGYKTIRFGGIAAMGAPYANDTAATASAIGFSKMATFLYEISGSLGALFPSRGTASTQQPHFRETFKSCSRLTTISSDLFSGVTGATSHQFYETFYGCSGLKSIPSGLFNDISGAPAQYMFYGTFHNCTGLTGSIPENLFSGISGAPAESMFAYTFSECPGLTGSIPGNLFSGISGAPANNMFLDTFARCFGLTGAISANLFSGISGAPAEGMFDGTFRACKGLTGSIPGNLFSGISGAPAERMFRNTFALTGITGSIPGNLFSGISGAPAERMFSDTFGGCEGLTGSIPGNLFSGISGAPADGMFNSTFSRCSGLNGSIPGNLFSGISGAPAEGMFNGTFAVTGITGSIPGNLFGNLSGEGADSMFQETFYSCSNLSGYIPKSIFENITSPGEYGTYYMFEETNLYTECPCGSVSAETGWGESLVDGRAVCQANPAEHLYNDVCVADCDAGVTTLRTSTGLEFPLFDTKPTTPALHIKHNGTVCYTPMEAGNGGAGSMNIMSGGETYHLGTLE